MEFLLLFLCGLGGILFHVIAKFRDALSKEPKKNQTPMKRLRVVWTKFDVLGNLSYALFAVLLILVVIGLRDTLNAVGIPVTYITLIFYGYAADSAFKNLKPENVN